MPSSPCLPWLSRQATGSTLGQRKYLPSCHKRGFPTSANFESKLAVRAPLKSGFYNGGGECLLRGAHRVLIQGINKRMERFQKLTRNLFLTLHGHNVHRQQRQLSTFLMCYQQFVSHAYFRAAVPVSKMASQQEKALCVLGFEVSRSVITVQREFRARFRKDATTCTDKAPA